MSWQFRKTFKVLPGVKLNLTRNGLSVTLGAAPFSVNAGPRGVYGNIGIPGTGMWDRVRLDRTTDAPPKQPDAGTMPLPMQPPPTVLPQVTEIHSASTERLGSHSLEALRNLLQEAYDERVELSKDIAVAQNEVSIATKQYQNWEHGFLFKRIFKQSFAKRKESYETAKAKREELQEQLRLTTLSMQIETVPEQAEPYYKLRDEFGALSESQKVWDTIERRAINRFVERSAAHEAITREPVSFSLASCDLIDWEQKVPHLPNRSGGDMYIYPGLILYRASKQAFALIDSREITVTFQPVRFIEEAALPSDAQVVDQVWAKSNKDGSPDRRFRDDYRIPVVLYGSLTFRSPTGLHEEFQVSNAARAERFAKAWNIFQLSFGRPLGQIPCDTSEPTGAATVWATESAEAQKLASERGQFWEFLLTQELLKSKLARLRQQYAEIASALSPDQKQPFSGPDYMNWLSEKNQEISPLAQQIKDCFEREMQLAWGKPGESGDANQILKAVNHLVGCCRSLFNWELQISAAEPPVNLRRLGIALGGAAAGAVSEVERIPGELARAVDGARTGTREFQIKLTFAAPPQLERFRSEMEQVKKHPEWLHS